MDEAGLELECRWCDEYWPLTREFWNVKRDGRVETDRCRSCERERGRLYYAIARVRPNYHAWKAEANRRYRYHIRRTNPELLGALDREQKMRERQSQADRRERRLAA